MRTFFLIAIFGFALIGCSTPKGIRAVWTEGRRPPADLPVPAGFIVTPAEAYARTAESDMISAKHNWYIYADSRYYYVHDIFLGSSARRAHNEGVRIDGRTGEIVRR